MKIELYGNWIKLYGNIIGTVQLSIGQFLFTEQAQRKLGLFSSYRIHGNRTIIQQLNELCNEY